MARRVKPPASVLGLITDILKQPEYGDQVLTTAYAFVVAQRMGALPGWRFAQNSRPLN
jgi:hypothetical protein